MRSIEDYPGVFHRMASRVHVGDIFTPFAETYFETDAVGEAIEDLGSTGRIGQPVLILGDHGPVGVSFASDPVRDPRAFDPDDEFHVIMEPIEPHQFMAAGTTLLEALRVLSGSDPAPAWHVVLDRDRFAGLFVLDDLMKLPARACLISMTLELETVALELCSHFAEPCWNALSEGRKKAAVTVFKRRLPEAEVPTLLLRGLDLVGDSAAVQLLLDCTTFIDKCTMIRKCRLWPDDRLEQIFVHAERLRNACAHTALLADDLPFDHAALPRVIWEIHDLIDSLRHAIPKVRDRGEAELED